MIWPTMFEDKTLLLAVAGALLIGSMLIMFDVVQELEPCCGCDEQRKPKKKRKKARKMLSSTKD
jgi:disulfide bond formation protein DsbB